MSWHRVIYRVRQHNKSPIVSAITILQSNLSLLLVITYKYSSGFTVFQLNIFVSLSVIPWWNFGPVQCFTGHHGLSYLQFIDFLFIKTPVVIPTSSTQPLQALSSANKWPMTHQVFSLPHFSASFFLPYCRREANYLICKLKHFYFLFLSWKPVFNIRMNLCTLCAWG